MTRFSSIDLSKLPAPDVITVPEFDALLAEAEAAVIAAMPEAATTITLESEPARKVLRVCTYLRALDRAEFNDNARACMLPTATGTNLDNLAAFWGVARLVVQVGDDTVDPPIAEILESDEALRARTQLSLEGHTTAGSRGAYTFWALSASGLVRDVKVQGDGEDGLDPGEVRVTVLSFEADGTASPALLSTVEAALNGEEVRPLCDRVIVQPATIVPYTIEAELTLLDGPDEASVLALAEARIADFTAAQNGLGRDVTRSGIFAALHVEGAVQNVTLAAPAADLVIGKTQAALCTAVTLTVGGRDV